jgi:hypothetical protein
MTASHTSCNCFVIASGPVGQILACPDCGTIHIALPQVSLRLAPDSFRDLSITVAKAQRMLDEARAQLAVKQAGKRPLH